MISIYENASNGYNSTATESSGKMIVLDYETMTAKLAGPTTYYPGSGLLSSSQGNMQVLDDGNRFTGWEAGPG